MSLHDEGHAVFNLKADELQNRAMRALSYLQADRPDLARRALVFGVMSARQAERGQ
jgi:hypothetical protein